MNDLTLMRKIFINEVNGLNKCLKRYLNDCDFVMFGYTLTKRGSYIDIAFKLGIISYKEYEKISSDEKFEIIQL